MGQGVGGSSQEDLRLARISKCLDVDGGDAMVASVVDGV